MPRINNKVEILRSLERTKEQFEVQYQQNCDGTRNGAYGEFSDTDKELMESFKKVYQLGITQLQDFVNQLDEKSDKIDEYSILYYITQLLNGPFSQHFKEFTANKGEKSIYAPSNDRLGSVTNSIKSNSTVPVFNSNSLNAGLGIFNKSTGFIQGILKDANRQTSNVFNFNFQSSVFDDNTLPFIDKAPRARSNAEGIINFGSASLGFGQISELGPTFIDAATSVAGSAVQEIVGQIAVAGNNVIRGAIGQLANLNPAADTTSIVDNITNSVMQGVNNGNVNIIQEAAGQVQVAGAGLSRNTVIAINQVANNAPMIGADQQFQSIAQSDNILPGLVNTTQGIVQNAAGQLLDSSAGVIQNASGLLEGNLQGSLENAMGLFSNQGISLNAMSFDNILQGAMGDLQNIGQGILQNFTGKLAASIGQGLGGGETVLGSFATGFVGGLFGGGSSRPSQSPVNAMGSGGGSWTPGTANANYMLKDIKMHNIISEATGDITKSLEASLGPAAFRLLTFKKTLNYFNAEENDSQASGDGISRLLTFMKKVRDQSGNEQIKQQCVEIETSLLGNNIVNDDTTNLKAYYNTGTVDLYTNTGRLGNRPIKPKGVDDVDITIDDIFTTIEAATERGIEIGCIGYHRHNEDGTTYYMPCDTMDEYCTLTGNCPEPVDPNNPLLADVECETTPSTTTPSTTTTTTLRPSPFVDIISALSQEEVPSSQEDLPEY